MLWQSLWSRKPDIIYIHSARATTFPPFFLIVTGKEAQFDFELALMRMNIHWRVRGGPGRGMADEYPITSFGPPDHPTHSHTTLLSFFGRQNKLASKTNKIWKKQMTNTPIHYLIWATWPPNLLSYFSYFGRYNKHNKLASKTNKQITNTPLTHLDQATTLILFLFWQM